MVLRSLHQQGEEGKREVGCISELPFMQPLDTSRYADETLLVSVIKTLEGNGNDRSVSYISSAVDMGAGQGALNKVKLNLYQIT